MRTSGRSNADDARPAPDRPIPRRGEHRLRVRYAECDPMGVAHHGSYAAWLELARTDLLRAGGVTYRQLEDAGVFLVITTLTVRYKSPARYDDLLIVRAEVTGGGRARIDHAYEVYRDDEDGRGASTLIAIGETTLACVNERGRPTPLPSWLVADAHA